MKNRKIKFLDYTFIFVMIIYIFIIGSSSTVEANIIFEGFAAPFNNNGNSYCYGYGEKEDFFTNHGWVPGSLYSNDFIESEIFLDDYSAVAYANLNVAPSSYFSTSFAAGHGGAAYGSFGFAFAAQPFNQFPSEGQIETVVPEPASILLIGIGFCAFGIIGKKKIS
ncbi:PEP-CTERM sorting domain-containing protein [Candidatus Desantisbacteria bacterium]|nr:PEP-CTERM sorting domain-containing protein [Candidatus Desantisbacteria bacterium]